MARIKFIFGSKLVVVMEPVLTAKDKFELVALDEALTLEPRLQNHEFGVLPHEPGLTVTPQMCAHFAKVSPINKSLKVPDLF